MKKNKVLLIIAALAVLTVLIGAILFICNQERVTYTVTFQDYDGTVLKTQTVKAGASAAAPEEPQREGYMFFAWDKDFSVVTCDMTVTAEYIQLTDTTFSVDHVTVMPGADNVAVKVSVAGNPGILGMALSVSYDEDVLTLVGGSNGVALSALAFQQPSKLKSGCNFVWYGSEIGEVTDGELLTLVFRVAQDAPEGTYPVTVSYNDRDIYNTDCDMLRPQLLPGSIVVTDEKEN